MQWTLFFYISALLMTVLAQRSNWSKSCTGAVFAFSGKNRTLQATCTFANGQKATSRLPLNDCFGNVNGHLICQRNGNAFQTCLSCLMDGPKLTCACTRRDGGFNSTNINMDVCIGNQDGQLVC